MSSNHHHQPAPAETEPTSLLVLPDMPLSSVPPPPPAVRAPHSFDRLADQPLGSPSEFPSWNALLASIRRDLDTRARSHVLDSNAPFSPLPSSLPRWQPRVEYPTGPTTKAIAGTDLGRGATQPPPASPISSSDPMAIGSSWGDALPQPRIFEWETRSFNAQLDHPDLVVRDPRAGLSPPLTARASDSTSGISNEEAIGSNAATNSVPSFPRLHLADGPASRRSSLDPPTVVLLPDRDIPEFAQPDDPDAAAAAFEDLPVEPTFFLHTVLKICMAGLQAVRTPSRSVAEALVACRLGLGCIQALDSGMAETLGTPWVPARSPQNNETNSEARARQTMPFKQEDGPHLGVQPIGTALALNEPEQPQKKGSGRGRKKAKTGQLPNGPAPEPGGQQQRLAPVPFPVIKRRSLAYSMPPEILLRIFTLLSESSTPDSSSVSLLFPCALVCKPWCDVASAELWKRVTMEDDAPRLGRFVIALSLSTHMGHQRGSLIRVISIACTDAELSLLLIAAPYLTQLQSLELRRPLLVSATSYRLLTQLPGKLPSLRSVLADLVPPSSLGDIVMLAWSLPLLSHLHVSMGPADSRGASAPGPSIPSFPFGVAGTPTTTLMANAPHQQSYSNFPTFSPDLNHATGNHIPFQSVLPHAATLPIATSPITSLFAQMSSITTLSLWRVALPRDEGLWVPALSRACPSIAAVRIDDCGPDLSMDVFVGLWRRCPHLETLVMRRVKRRAVFTTLVDRPAFRRVVLDACWISDALCEEIGRCARGLQGFYVEDDWLDEDFRDEGAPTVVSDLTDVGVLALAKYLRHLRSISFLGFPGRRNFHASSLSELIAVNPSCIALNLARMHPAWPHRITDAWLLELAPSLTNIRVLELYIQSAVSEPALLRALALAAGGGSLGAFLAAG
ncbi:hypothetical protein DFJ73DRAFT_581913 [Zopfochytrium polystomum]|nr:hypothetical protein DFJ73DRAFT_581913 [Zopfochytrium polystomum]